MAGGTFFSDMEKALAKAALTTYVKSSSDNNNNMINLFLIRQVLGEYMQKCKANLNAAKDALPACTLNSPTFNLLLNRAYEAGTQAIMELALDYHSRLNNLKDIEEVIKFYLICEKAFDKLEEKYRLSNISNNVEKYISKMPFVKAVMSMTGCELGNSEERELMTIATHIETLHGYAQEIINAFSNSYYASYYNYCNIL